MSEGRRHFPLLSIAPVFVGRRRAPVHACGTRSEELGAKEFMLRQGAAYVRFRKIADNWLRVERSYGPAAMTGIYQAVLAGKTDPASGQIISMWPQGDE